MAENYMNQTEIERALKDIFARIEVEMEELFASSPVTGLDSHYAEEAQIFQKYRPEYERLYRLLEKVKKEQIS